VIIPPLASLALLAALTLPAAAQTRIVVVPDGAAVVVPPRGAAPVAAARAPMRTARRRLAPDDAVPLGMEGAEASASPLLALVPLAAAAVLAATLPGSGGGGGSGPVRTR
jgi:hypothetical protein